MEEIEKSNKIYQIEIDNMKALKDSETQKVLRLQTEMEQLSKRIQDLEHANQKNENLAAERCRQL